MKVVISQEPSLFSDWDCEEILGAHVLAMQPELGAETNEQMSLSPQIGDWRSFKPDRLLHKCVKTHKKRHLLFFISHWEFFCFEAVNLVCRFHIMVDSDTQTQICVRYPCYLQPSPGSRERSQHLNSSSQAAPRTFHQLPGRCKNEQKSS